MQRRGAQTRERQVREPVSQRRAETLELGALLRVEAAKLMAQRARHLLGRDLLEAHAQIPEPRAERPRGELRAQMRAAGLDWVKKYDWDESARRHVEVFRSLL